MSRMIVVIMAGGLGKRMNSDLPKVLHEVGGRPMLLRVLEQARSVGPERILVVVGKYRGIIEATLREWTDLGDVEFILQPEPMGTGHAILCCRERLLQECVGTRTLILSGDVPMITSRTMGEILERGSATITVTKLSDPTGYGRIVTGLGGVFERIREDKDCSSEEKLIRTVNCGIYAFETDLLCRYLPSITNQNSQGEYYLTDIVEIIKRQENMDVSMYEISEDRQIEIIGVNTRQQLIDLSNQLLNQ